VQLTPRMGLLHDELQRPARLCECDQLTKAGMNAHFHAAKSEIEERLPAIVTNKGNLAL